MAKKTVKRKRGFKTARELLSAISGDWLDAGVAICSGIGKPNPILRLSLNENADGSLLVMFHEEHANRAMQVEVSDV